MSGRVIRVSDCFADYLNRTTDELSKKSGREYSQIETSAIISTINPPVIVVASEQKKKENGGVFGF